MDVASNTTCVKITSESIHGHLHPNQIYHICVKAVNTAGLSVVAESAPHKHVVQLPTAGVVYDILPLSEEVLPASEVKM